MRERENPGDSLDRWLRLWSFVLLLVEEIAPVLVDVSVGAANAKKDVSCEARDLFLEVHIRWSFLDIESRTGCSPYFFPPSKHYP